MINQSQSDNVNELLRPIKAPRLLGLVGYGIVLKDRLREAQQARLVRRVKSNPHRLPTPLKLKQMLLMLGLR
jgi:hypothetical protein